MKANCREKTPRNDRRWGRPWLRAVIVHENLAKRPPEWVKVAHAWMLSSEEK